MRHDWGSVSNNENGSRALFLEHPGYESVALRIANPGRYATVAPQCMSRKGNCFDNAVVENFFGHLKAEMYHGDYIDWYNTQRVQEQLEGMTPLEYRNHALKNQTL